MTLQEQRTKLFSLRYALGSELDRLRSQRPDDRDEIVAATRRYD